MIRWKRAAGEHNLRPHPCRVCSTLHLLALRTTRIVDSTCRPTRVRLFSGLGGVARVDVSLVRENVNTMPVRRNKAQRDQWLYVYIYSNRFSAIWTSSSLSFSFTAKLFAARVSGIFHVREQEIPFEVRGVPQARSSCVCAFIEAL